MVRNEMNTISFRFFCPYRYNLLSGIISECPHIWASLTISVPSQNTVHLKMLHVESHLSCFLLFFSLNVFYGQAFINLFYSSSPLFQFPGKKPLVGCNVRAISVSVPFFPCVNALPSKSTASLCIYCVRRWVLSFFSFSWMKSVRFFESWEWYGDGLLVRHEWETEWANALRERENLNASVRCRKATCWLRRTCVSECERRQQVFFLCRTIRRTFIYILPSLLFCLPSFLIMQSYIKSCIKKIYVVECLIDLLSICVLA